MPGAQINPLLIQQLTNKNLKEIPESPTMSWLPGKYARLINRQKDSIQRHFPEHYFMIKCKSCGRKGKYDVGLMVINPEYNQDDFSDKIQTTGYFRCKHCNDAGNWEMPSQFMVAPTAALLAELADEQQERYSIGKSQLYDGSSHKYSSDAETHLLLKLKNDSNNSIIWNRLGNLFDKGGRPEVAAAVFEHSLNLDHKQIESHFTLGGYLFQIQDYENAAYHYKQTLIFASDYNFIPINNLRELVAISMVELFNMNLYTDGKIPFLPEKKELEAAGKIEEINENYVDLEVELFAGDPESFYPLAEMYLGSQRAKLLKKDRTLKIPKQSPNKKKRWKKKKKNK